MPCYSPLKGYRDKVSGGITFRKESGIESMEVACGQCLGCRLDYAKMWAIRIVHESEMHADDHGNSFVTLTYRDPEECTEEQYNEGYYVPNDWSLNKKHFQDFMKRLRFHYGQKIRFFHCGEYGNRCKHGLDLDVVSCPLCNVGRPHYHACLFNVTFDDLESYGTAPDGSLRYTSPKLESIWKYGFVDVGEVNYQTANYVARYILKKVNGAKSADHYLSCDMDGEITFLDREYVTMSRRPGIGKDWYEKYKDDVFPSDEVPVPGCGVYKKVPRYYEEIFKCTDVLSYEEIKRLRQVYRRSHAEEFTPEKLMSKYLIKKKQVETLKRSVS